MNREAIQMWDQMNQFGKSSMTSVLKLNEIASRSVERLAEHQLGVFGDCFERAVSQLKVISDAKDVQAIMLGQARLASECSEKWLASARKAVEISLQAQTELGQWINETVGRLTPAAPVQEAVQKAA